MEISENSTISLPKINYVSRIASIDVFRALTMFLMIFVNDFWSIKGVPHWMEHAAHSEDMLGLSDIVFPSFLFILGMSIPLAIKGRLNKNESKASVAKHIFIRSTALLIMGLFSVNIERGISHSVGISRPVFSLIMVACFFVIWNNYQKKENRLYKNIVLIMKIIAGLILVTLAATYRAPSGEYFQHRWWGILGLIGWTYLLCALIYLFFHKKNIYLILFTVFFVLLCIAGANKWLGSFSGIIPGNGCFHAFTMFGLLLSLGINLPENKNSVKKILSIAAAAGLIFLVLGRVANGWWIISKLQETPTWLFYCTGISILSYIVIYWLCDIRNGAHWFNIIKPAGTSTLTCYLIPSILYSIFALTGFKGISFMSEGFWGLIKCLLFAFLAIGITALLEKMHIKLKL